MCNCGFYANFVNQINATDKEIDGLDEEEKGEITSSEYQTQFDVAERTARYDLTDLVVKNLLVKVGDKKSTKYVFADKLPIE